MLQFILSLEGCRRTLRALNGLQFILSNEGPLKEAFSSFCCIFPQPADRANEVVLPQVSGYLYGLR